VSDDSTKDVEIARLQERIVALRNVIERDIVEVRRRLDELNHEHARNLERNKEYLAAPLFYQNRDAVDARLGTIERTLATQAGKSAAWVSIIGALFLIANIALHYVK
jgi:hypothetical protein